MKICIFCGANRSQDASVLPEIKKVMGCFAANDVHLVYGGAAIGVMGELANELMSLNGKVTGIIPRQLMKKEIAHPGLTELIVVTDMHERKKKMYEMSDAFLIFPGGMGTLDELFEILTWRQLGLHSKPIAIFNINGYFDHLTKFLDRAVSDGLVKEKDRMLLYTSGDWSEVWEYLNLHVQRKT